MPIFVLLAAAEKNTAEKQTDSRWGILIHEAIEQMIKENGASRDYRCI